MLDTETAGRIIRGRSVKIEEKLAAVAPDRLCVSAVTRAELMYGLKRVAEGHRAQVAVRQFLKIVRALAWDEAAADAYAEIRHKLTSQRREAGEMDMMIAAHALTAGAVLVTRQMYLGWAVPGLAVVTW